MRSIGYSFFIESFILRSNRFPIVKAPITLLVRTQGHSKMTVLDAFRTTSWLWEFRLEAKCDPGRFRLAGRAS